MTREDKKITYAREVLYTISMREHLNAISMYAYHQDCYGLTQEECETLERLCDKAERGIVRAFAKTLFSFNAEEKIL